MESHDIRRSMSPAEAASYWHVRRDGRSLTAQEQAEFDQWLAASPDHAEHLERMSTTWNRFEGHEQDPDLSAMRAAALAQSPNRPRAWRAAAGGMLAASIAAGLFLLPQAGRLDTTSEPVPSVQMAQQGEVHSTRKGELRTVALADGSKVTLNTDSSVEVNYSEGQRILRLVRGQALFQVAHDKARPFVVQAGDRKVTALGTTFEIRLDPGRTRVTLVEGRVAIDRRGVAGPGKPDRTMLRPGEEFVLDKGKTERVASVDVSTKLLWREGMVEFADEPLSEAVREINRYSRRPIVVKDGRLADQRISGVFRTGDPARFVAIVGELLPVEARQSADHIELVRKGMTTS